MAKIEDMPWLRSCGLNNVERRISRRFGSRQQDHRIEVALQRNARSQLPASNADIGRPVESHGIAAAGGNDVQPLTAALGEDDRGNPAVLIAEALQHGTDVTQRKGVVRVGGKQATPGVENHYHVGAVSDLLRKIR